MAWLPLPENTGEALGKGIESGSKLFKGLIEAETFKQDLAYKQALAEQQWREHMENHALRQQQEERLLEELALAQQLHPYTLQNLISQINSNNETAAEKRFNRDPAAQMDFIRALSGQGQMQGEPVPQDGQPLSTTGINNGGQGQTLDNVPHYADMDALKAQIIKNRTGINIYDETPQQKRERERAEKAADEGAKAKAESERLTPANRTQLQNIVLGADTVLPIIDELIRLPAPIHFGPWTTSPADLAVYESLVSGGVEGLVNAYGLTSTVINTELMEKKLSRRPGEQEEDYKKRLKKEREEVLHRSKYAENALAENKANAKYIPPKNDNNTSSNVSSKKKKYWNEKTKAWEE